MTRAAMTGQFGTRTHRTNAQAKGPHTEEETA